jgi:hypothetical protein
MKSVNSIITRVDKKFMNEIEDMKLIRIKSGKDKPLKPAKNSRLTLAITRHPLFPKIKLDIINADLK